MTKEEQQRQLEERFKIKNMPLPIPKSEIALSIEMAKAQNVRNPSALATIEEIKRGTRRREMSELVQKADNISHSSNIPVYQNIPVSTPSQNRGTQQGTKKVNIPLQSFIPEQNSELNMAQELFNDNYSPPLAPVYQQQQQQVDDGGAEWQKKFRARFYKNAEEKIAASQQYSPNLPPQQQQYMPPQTAMYNQPAMQSGLLIVNENDLEAKIERIASQIAESKIKTVLNEYIKQINQKKGTFVESDKVKKAEIVGENIIKIDGKHYKVSPVNVTPKKVI